MFFLGGAFNLLSVPVDEMLKQVERDKLAHLRFQHDDEKRD